MSIKILTDSTCDISAEELKKLDVEIIRLKVIFGEKQYVDGVDLSTEEFYKMLAEEKSLPTTTQGLPYQFTEIFNKFKDDSIIYIGISSALSGTVSSATVARNSAENNENIFVIDSKNVTLGLALLVKIAVALREKGLSAKEIVSEIENLKEKVSVYAAVDTLKYLHKGGRLSKASMVLGGIAGIKPIITITDGKVVNIAKAKGIKNAIEFIKDSFLKEYDESYPVCFAHSLAAENIDALISLISKNKEIKNYTSVQIGPVVGTHAGPGAFGVAFIRK